MGNARQSSQSLQTVPGRVSSSHQVAVPVQDLVVSLTPLCIRQ